MNYRFAERCLRLRTILEELSVDGVAHKDSGNLAMPEAATSLSRLKDRLEIFNLVSEVLPENLGDDFLTAADSHTQLLRTISALSPNMFAQQSGQLRQSLMINEQRFVDVWPYIAALAAERSGALYPQAFSSRLQDEMKNLLGELRARSDQESLTIRELASGLEDKLRSFNSKQQELNDHASSELQARLKAISEEAAYRATEASTRILEAAAAQADKIELRAREASKEISIKAAQDQFNIAQNPFRIKAAAWSALSTGAVIAFFVLATKFYNQADTKMASLPTQELIYRSVIRVTILTAVGALITFFLKMTRAHFHMMELNAHRRRVANSIVTFVDAAMTKEQRDLILGKLVESVVDFGESGLLDKEKDGIVGPTFAVDALSKTFNQKS